MELAKTVLETVDNYIKSRSTAQAMLILFAAGSLTALSFAPLYLWPLSLCFVALILFSNNDNGLWKNMWLGWSYGFGYFTIGLYWISNALFVDIEKFWWLLPFSIFGLPALLGFFTAIPSVMARGLKLRGIGFATGMVIFWVLAEWLRAHLFTGFPWNLIGYNLCFSNVLIQSASIFGVYGLSILTLLPSWALSCWVITENITFNRMDCHVGVNTPPRNDTPSSRGRRKPDAVIHRFINRSLWPTAVSFIIIIISMVFGFLRLQNPTEFHDDMWIRIVQPSIPQNLKWDPEERENNFYRLISLSQQPSNHKIKAIIWPETAIPFFLDRDEIHKSVMQETLSEGSFLVTGAPRRTPDFIEDIEIWNSIIVMNKDGHIVNHYDKSHLVPFGEYMPLRKFLEPYIALNKITAGSIDFSAGSGPRKITIDSIPPFSGLVCYESIFPGEVSPKGTNRPQWMLNVTNDAWYGRSAGPYQHLEISRMRAVEEGMPLVRSANNGISAVFDAYGRKITQIKLMDVGIRDFQLPKAMENATIYGAYGDKTILLLILFLGLCCFFMGGRKRIHE